MFSLHFAFSYCVCTCVYACAVCVCACERVCTRTPSLQLYLTIYICPCTRTADRSTVFIILHACVRCIYTLYVHVEVWYGMPHLLNYFLFSRRPSPCPVMRSSQNGSPSRQTSGPLAPCWSSSLWGHVGQAHRERCMGSS